MFRESKDKQISLFDRLLTANEQTSKAVEQSRAKMVGDVIYPNVDESRFEFFFSSDKASRPNIEIRRYVSALILKSMYGMQGAGKQQKREKLRKSIRQQRPPREKGQGARYRKNEEDGPPQERRGGHHVRDAPQVRAGQDTCFRHRRFRDLGLDIAPVI